MTDDLVEVVGRIEQMAAAEEIHGESECVWERQTNASYHKRRAVDLHALLAALSSSAAREAALVAALEGDLARAIAEVPAGWWWSVCRCNLTCDASVGPDFRHPDCPREHIEPFDSGFHVALDLPSTVGEALRQASREAKEAIAARLLGQAEGEG